MVRFGIAGFGLHAVKRLMPGFAKAGRCQVTALSRRNLPQAQESARQFGIPYAFASTSELCACPYVDAVFVSTPDGLHCDGVLEAIRQGKPVLCEKPMAMNPQQAMEMVQAARAARVLLGVAQVMRFEESVRVFREHVCAGSIGRPVVARADFFAPMLTSARKWVNDASLATGGPLADLGVHCIDALRFILGQEVRAVSALAAYDANGVAEASATAVLHFDTGMLGTVSVSARTPYQTYLEVAGETGVLGSVNALSVEHPPTVELRRGFEVIERREVSNSQAYALQVDGFAAAVEEGREFEIPGEEGLRNQLVLDAAFRSVKSGKVEAV
jgi:predicted dehydrogenase